MNINQELLPGDVPKKDIPPFAIQKIAGLRASLLIAQQAYYEKDKPVISDSGYDDYLSELIKMEEEYLDEISYESPANKNRLANPKAHFKKVRDYNIIYTKHGLDRAASLLDDKCTYVAAIRRGVEVTITYSDGRVDALVTNSGINLIENCRDRLRLPENLEVPSTRNSSFKCIAYVDYEGDISEMELCLRTMNAIKGVSDEEIYFQALYIVGNDPERIGFNNNTLGYLGFQVPEVHKMGANTIKVLAPTEETLRDSLLLAFSLTSEDVYLLHHKLYG